MSKNLYFKHPEYASFWARLTAFALDSFIIVIPVFAIVLEIISAFVFDRQAITESKNKDIEVMYQLYHNLIFVSIGAFTTVGAIYAFFLTSRWQATPGKRLVGVYVASEQNAKLKFSTAFGRSVSLPFLVMLIQIFERNAIYEKLDAIKSSDKTITTMAELQQQLINPASQITSLILFGVLSFWFLRIFFHKERAAGHDSLFNTRVFIGKK